MLPPIDVVFALLTYAMLPFVGAWWFLRCWRLSGRVATPLGTLAALLFAGMLSFPVTMVVWILGCLLTGLFWGMATGDLSTALQAAFKLAVPLTVSKDIVPYGLWLPLLVWLPIMIIASAFFRRSLEKE